MGWTVLWLPPLLLGCLGKPGSMVASCCFPVPAAMPAAAPTLHPACSSIAPTYPALQAQFGDPSAALSNATILVPTNEAMESAPPEVRALFSNPGATAALLAYQTLEGVHKVADLADGQRLPTFARDAQVGGVAAPG